MNAPISLTSIGLDVADLKAKSTKYTTDYNVSIIVTKTTDTTTTYNYSYLVKFKYCNIYTISGMLYASNATTATPINTNVISNVYLCDGKMYDSGTYMPFAVKGYTAEASRLVFTFSTFVSGVADLYVIVPMVSTEGTSSGGLVSTPIHKLYHRLTGQMLPTTIILAPKIFPIVIENAKNGSPCFVNIYGSGDAIDTTIFPTKDSELSTFTINCFIVE